MPKEASEHTQSESNMLKLGRALINEALFLGPKLTLTVRPGTQHKEPQESGPPKESDKESATEENKGAEADAGNKETADDVQRFEVPDFPNAALSQILLQLSDEATQHVENLMLVHLRDRERMLRMLSTLAGEAYEEVSGAVRQLVATRGWLKDRGGVVDALAEEACSPHFAVLVMSILLASRGACADISMIAKVRGDPQGWRVCACMCVEAEVLAQGAKVCVFGVFRDALMSFRMMTVQ